MQRVVQVETARIAKDAAREAGVCIDPNLYDTPAPPPPSPSPAPAPPRRAKGQHRNRPGAEHEPGELAGPCLSRALPDSGPAFEPLSWQRL